MAATDARNDPYRGFNFVVDFGDQTIAAFTEVSGLTGDGDAVDYREGTEKTNNVRKLVGLRKFPNVMLKRGYTRNNKLWLWYVNIANGTPDRRDGTITLLDEARTPVLRWKISAAWVNNIKGPDMKASANDVALESVELCHEGLAIELA
ncbi:MAG: phage tail protein [Rhodopila sp.]